MSSIQRAPNDRKSVPPQKDSSQCDKTIFFSSAKRRGISGFLPKSAKLSKGTCRKVVKESCKVKSCLHHRRAIRTSFAGTTIDGFPLTWSYSLYPFPISELSKVFHRLYSIPGWPSANVPSQWQEGRKKRTKRWNFPAGKRRARAAKAENFSRDWDMTHSTEWHSFIERNVVTCIINRRVCFELLFSLLFASWESRV